MPKEKQKLPSESTRADVDSFLAKVAASPPPAKRPGERGRLIFAMDATASREPTWDAASHIQGQMFEETAALGGLDVKLVYYRGFKQFYKTPWVGNAKDLLLTMTEVTCSAGMTQIERVLEHAIDEAQKGKVNALVFVGDCMEEDIDRLCGRAGELGLLGVPAFMFHEGTDLAAERAFKQIAHLTRGAYCHFDAASAQHLRELLGAVAVFAAGGRKALEDFGKRRGGMALQLTHQINKSR
ncbi:MAG: VWA domain-containing protein [Gammaproteobacteria bacterium]|nr:VWA domain-containing protein [Gammaproteobacteria bacterium]